MGMLLSWSGKAKTAGLEVLEHFHPIVQVKNCGMRYSGRARATLATKNKDCLSVQIGWKARTIDVITLNAPMEALPSLMAINLPTSLWEKGARCIDHPQGGLLIPASHLAGGTKSTFCLRYRYNGSCLYNCTCLHWEECVAFHKCSTSGVETLINTGK
jgi:hypothetical protein